MRGMEWFDISWSLSLREVPPTHAAAPPVTEEEQERTATAQKDKEEAAGTNPARVHAHARSCNLTYMITYTLASTLSVIRPYNVFAFGSPRSLHLYDDPSLRFCGS